MKQLVVNADDFGYTPGVNRAIVDAHRSGIVTSTSLLANGPAFADAVEQARMTPELDVGCHLNFVEAAPVSPPDRVPHLVGADGKFHTVKGLGLRLLAGLAPLAELEREGGAQIERLLQAGIRPSHLDTHQHTHMHPTVATAVARAAQRYGIAWVRRLFENYLPLRLGGAWQRRAVAFASKTLAPSFQRRMAAHGVRTPDFFTGFVLTGRLTPRALEGILTVLPEGVTELVCHPGYCDRELQAAPTRLRREREVEWETVADAAWQVRLREWGIVLTNFRELTPAPPWVEKNSLLAVPAPAIGE